MIIIKQVGKDCIVTLDGISETIKYCNAIILANTLWNKPGAKYTEERMAGWLSVERAEEIKKDEKI